MHRYLGRRGPVPKVSETGAERRDVWCQAGRLAVNPTTASKLKRDKVIIGVAAYIHLGRGHSELPIVWHGREKPDKS